MFSSGLYGLAIGHPNVLILTPAVVGLPSHSDSVHTSASQKTDHPSIPSSATANFFFLKRQEGHPCYQDLWASNHSFILIGYCRLQSIQ